MLLYEFQTQQQRWRLCLSYWGWWWGVRWWRGHCCFSGWPIDGGGPIGWFTQSPERAAAACVEETWSYHSQVGDDGQSRQPADQTLTRINPIHSSYTWHPGTVSGVRFITPFTDAVNVLTLHCGNMTQTHVYRIDYLMVHYHFCCCCMTTTVNSPNHCAQWFKMNWW